MDSGIHRTRADRPARWIRQFIWEIGCESGNPSHRPLHRARWIRVSIARADGSRAEITRLADSAAARERSVSYMQRKTAARRLATTRADSQAASREPDIDALAAELHRAHALTLVRMATLLLRDRPCAEDVVQDTFLSLYRVLPKLTDRDEILPYLRTAVLNRTRSALRSRRRALARSITHEPDVSSAESAAMITQDRRRARRAGSQLPRRPRGLLVLGSYP